MPVDFPPVYVALNENQLVRAQQNQKGDTDIIPITVTVYLFLAKIRCRFSKMPKVYRWIFRLFTVH